MFSCLDKVLTLVCSSGETIQVPENLLEESSMYIKQVLLNSSSKVLLFPGVQLDDLKKLISQIETGSCMDESLREIANKYGFKSENVEPNLPLKKRPLDNSPPSSPELVIDESYSSSKVSPSSEESLSQFLPWPLLLEQVALQNSYKDSDKHSKEAAKTTKSPLFDQIDSAERLGSKDSISCKECGKMFRASTLNIHMRRVHRVLQKPVNCCGQDFPTRWHLTQHRKSGDHLPTLWKTECEK